MSEALIGTIIVCVTVLFGLVILSWANIQGKKADHDLREALRRESGPQPDGLAWRVPASDSLEKAVIDKAAKLRGALPGYESLYTYSGDKTREEVPATDAPLVEPKHEPDLNKMAPMEWDEADPPRRRVYNPRPGSTAPAPKCFCHDKDLEVGQTILMWRLKDSEEVRIFCQRDAS